MVFLTYSNVRLSLLILGGKNTGQVASYVTPHLIIITHVVWYIDIDAFIAIDISCYDTHTVLLMLFTT